MLRRGREPLHVQLADMLVEQIRSGILGPGDQLPTEKELRETYQVSSSTVRHAVMSLVNDGLVYREAGRGTFVTQPKIGRDPLQFCGFSEDALAQGFRPGTKEMSCGWTRATDAVAEALGIPLESEVFQITRVRTIDEAVVALERVTLSGQLGKRVALFDLSSGSLTRCLEGDLGCELAHAEQVIRAVTATPADAATLGVRNGAPLLGIDRTALTSDDVPVYFSSSLYRADRYVYRGWITRPRLALAASAKSEKAA